MSFRLSWIRVFYSFRLDPLKKNKKEKGGYFAKYVGERFREDFVFKRLYF